MSEIFVRPDVRAFLDFLDSLPGPKINELEAPAARAQSRAMRELADVAIGEHAVIRDLKAPGPQGAIPLRLFDARGARGPGPVLVFFHGGGRVLGDLDVYA